jgi:diguanylate cyclase (GGDEF)-like protein/PAS domain S-box-containing protein
LPFLRLINAVAVLLVLGFTVPAARAVEAVNVRLDAAAIDLTDAVERPKTDGDMLQVSTAPGADGIVRRIGVRDHEPGGSWAVFALANSSDQQIDRLIVVPHYRMVGSGFFWPDLGLSRVVSVTPSSGDRPDRQDSPTADIFRLTLDPGTVITYVVELRSEELPQLYLWDPDAYKDKVNSFTLYHGIVIGIAGLLALFLTILFVVKGSVMFPAAAALGWAVLIYIGVDFGFWGKVFDMSAGAERIWRAAGEAILAATLLVFLFAYLNLNRWRALRARHHCLAGGTRGAGWCCSHDPPIASGISRLSMLLVAIAGFVLVVYLAVRGFDRAVLLIPTWFLLLIWVVAAGFTIAGIVTNDIVAPALLGGLVLIVMLIGFTVMQHAFAGGVTHGLVSDVERRALALAGAGDVVWDWDVSTDKVFTGPEAETMLGLRRGTLEGSAAHWLEFVHPTDRDRFRATLDGLLEHRRGRLIQDIRLRGSVDHYLWFTLKARPVVGSDGEVVRLVGTLTDVTEFKTAEERLLHDAVRDNLTGLPNRALFLNQLDSVLALSKADPAIKATVMVIDLDRFKQVNDTVGMAVGDSILLTIARRLGRLLKPQDALARLAGDQFGLVLLSVREATQITTFGETLRKALRAPIAFNDREIFLTASIGLALGDSQPTRGEELLTDAELAMVHAKRLGGDRIEVFKPTMRAQDGQACARGRIETGNRARADFDPIPADRPAQRPVDRRFPGPAAVGSRQIREAILGRIPRARGRNRPRARTRNVRARSGGTPARRPAAHDRVREPLFVSIDVASRQLLRQEFVNDLRALLGHAGLARGTLQIELTEAMVMENPEYSAQVLQRMHEFGAGLMLAGFGNGHSSLEYLQRFPFDTLKIDQSLVRPNNKGKRPVILRSVVMLAHDLGMKVVAEGADTDADVSDLNERGCEFALGSLIGEPVDATKAGGLLSRDKVVARNEPAHSDVARSHA